MLKTIRKKEKNSIQLVVRRTTKKKIFSTRYKREQEKPRVEYIILHRKINKLIFFFLKNKKFFKSIAMSASLYWQY